MLDPTEDLVMDLAKRMMSANPAMERTLASFVARAQERWPRVRLADGASLIQCLEARGLAPDGELAKLDAADAGEVWLSAACAAGEPTALSAFDDNYVLQLRPALKSMGLDDPAVEDLQQRVRHRLLTAEPDEPIRLFQYAGDGKLFGLVKVVAIRMALDDIRRAKRAPDRGSADERTVARLMDGALGPELALAESQNKDAVKAAFQGAIDALPPGDRAILRLHLHERSSIDEIAALHDVHRATAARWVVRIREAIAASTHEALKKKLSLDDERLHSLLRAVDSRLDLSLSRVLAVPAEPEDDP